MRAALIKAFGEPTEMLELADVPVLHHRSNRVA
jgi:hypothetical protein